MSAEPTNLPPGASCAGCAARDRRVAALEARVAALEQALQQATRSGRRQAAPFSKGPPKADPKKPGRKPGDQYGPNRAFRPAPPRVDEVHEAPLPACCPDCGGAVSPTHSAQQYQVEIPREPLYRRFDVRVGECRGCGKRVQGRHPLQTSDALGAAASQLGPDAQAAAVYLNKHAGLSHGKVAQVFSGLFGIGLTAGGVSQTILRAGRRCEGDYQSILDRVRAAPWAVPDETGWRAGGLPGWLHVAVTADAIAFGIFSGDGARGFAASAQLLGEGCAGHLVHDGWRPYQLFRHATHQQCVGHLLRRCGELLDVATGGAVVFPRKAKALLQEGPEVRDARDAGTLSAGQAAAAADGLQQRLGALCLPVKTLVAKETFAAHLYRRHRDVFTFLRVPGLDATNHKAEQALRPAVVNRKVWGGSGLALIRGNRTAAGARAQSVLMSVLRTACLRGRDFIDYLSHTLRGDPDRPPLLPAPSG
jgi:transposase